MIWEGRALREITEADVRRLVEGWEEHLHLEYKSDLYEPGERGGRELLLDTCMFAHAEGGILLIGIAERRDGHGQPTGEPDPAAPLGIVSDNPDSVLLSYDSRIVSNIEERIRTRTHN